MEPEDFGKVRRIVIALAMRLKSNVEFFYRLPFLETLEIMGEVIKLGKKK